jgi:lysophospholipase L1-like esterase
MAPLARIAFLLWVVAVLAAIWIQDHSGVLPLGLFNEGRREYEWLSAASLAVFAAIAALFVAEMLRRKPIPPAGALRGLIVSFLLLELLLFAADATLVSRGASSRLGGPYREFQSASGQWVWVTKAHAGSPYGFRTASPYAKREDRLRILFLGDSYTEGSGSAPGCNYPEVAAARLSERIGAPVQAMNAGVGGYGPADARNLLEHLAAEGYRFDAVVYSLFLENDFTDNLPGTERRVVAGINFRFPESRFLRAFHPLNSRTFRYALFVVRTGRLDRGAREQALRREGRCRTEGEKLTEIGDALRSLVERRLDANYSPQKSLTATAVMSRALAGLEEKARLLGIPFVLVVFPDRILADEDLRRLLNRDLAAEGYDPQRLRRWIEDNVKGPPVLDTTEVLRGGSQHYRRVDTHLSDLGNVVAGEWVGERLATLLFASGPKE